MDKLSKKISKIIMFILCFILILLTQTGCSKNQSAKLEKYVSELKIDILEGYGKSHNVTCNFTYFETPFLLDGTVNNKVPTMVFKIKDKVDENVTTLISFTYNQIDYQGEFVFDPIKNSYFAKFIVDSFSEKTVDILVSEGANIDNITLRSIVPNDTISYQVALNNIYDSQQELLDTYKTENGYNFELIMRIVVKDGKPYYYVAILSKSVKLKAFLVDGFSGELLAIRQVF